MESGLLDGDKGFRSRIQQQELTGTQDKKRKGQLFCFAAAQGQNHTVKHKKGEPTAVGL